MVVVSWLGRGACRWRCVALASPGNNHVGLRRECEPLPVAVLGGQDVKNKATLLHQVWDITVGADDEEVVFHERPEVKAIRAEPDLARRFHLQAPLSTATARRMTPFTRAVEGAAASEPAAAEMVTEMNRQRYEGIGVMAREAAKTGQLKVTEQECRDFMWAMTDGHMWHQLVVERGWTDEQFATWLGDMWVVALVKAE